MRMLWSHCQGRWTDFADSWYVLPACHADFHRLLHEAGGDDDAVYGAERLHCSWSRHLARNSDRSRDELRSDSLATLADTLGAN